jgi:homoserine O-acetyltransferase
MGVPFAADSVGLVTPQKIAIERPLLLDCGRELPRHDLMIETYGTLNAQRSNAVLICHALSGDHHAAGYHSPGDRKPGWWDACIGPGKPIDTNRFHVVALNNLGGCRGSTGPNTENPETGQPWGPDFPIVTVRDWTRSQALLADALGIDCWAAVIGGSLGGMQVLQWAIDYPTRLRHALVIAAAPRVSAQNIAFNEIARQAILSDPDFHGGRYYEHGVKPERGLKLARMLGHITYLSDEAMRARFGRLLRDGDGQFNFNYDVEFEVESYLRHQGQSFVSRFDANTYLLMTKALDYFDPAREFQDDLAAALRHATAKFLVVAFSSDWRFSPQRSREIVKALVDAGRDVDYALIESALGHDDFLLPVPAYLRVLHNYLSRVADEVGGGRSSPAPAPPQPPRAPAPASPAPAAASSGGAARRRRESAELRADLVRITDWIKPGSSILDLGCGDGALLDALARTRNVRGYGLEIDTDNVAACVDRGINVIQADVDEGLAEFANASFDYVVMTQALQALERPDLVVDEMLRVGREVIVTFPNFGHWRVRVALARGRMPLTPALPGQWYDTSNIHLCTLADFEALCREHGWQVLERALLDRRHQMGPAIAWLPNLFCEIAMYKLRRPVG